MVNERERLARIADMAAQVHSDLVLVGPGDDAAVLSVPSGKLAVTTDTVTEAQDFLLRWPSGRESTGEDIGWKAAGQNLSDLNAMNATPIALVVSITSREDLPEDFPLQVTGGILNALRAMHLTVPIIGGDLGKGAEISVTITAMGDQGQAPLLRSGAHPGDVLCVSGELGLAAAGLALLQDSSVSAQDGGPAAVHAHETAKRAIHAQQRPTPNLQLGAIAAGAGVTSAIDISDGLLSECLHLAQASNVSVNLNASAIRSFAQRLDRLAERLGASALDWVIAGGEDYELLVTLPKHADVPADFKVIGEILPARREPGVFINGHEVNRAFVGWDPWQE